MPEYMLSAFCGHKKVINYKIARCPISFQKCPMVDIRSVKIGKRSERKTKTGVSLTLEEFKKALVYLKEHEEYPHHGDGDDGPKMRRLHVNNYLSSAMMIRLEKDDFKSSISVSFSEIEKICKHLEDIERYFLNYFIEK